MAYTTVNKSSDFFNTKLYTGTGSSNALTGVGHNPDFVWIKSRADSYSHFLFDAVRGVYKRIKTNSTDAETESNESLKSFDSDGFTLGTQANINNSGSTYASWNWKAGGGQGSSNTAGSINTTYTSVNTTSGFSISSYTGTGSNATVGHGLGVAPDFIIIKSRTETRSWVVGNSKSGWTKWLALESTDAESTSSSIWNDTAPTSSVFSIGTSAALNGSGQNFVAYCFAEKTGYSKIGSYVGNSEVNGTFVYTGFKPAFVLSKDSTNAGENWFIHDNKRDTYNPVDTYIRPNLSNTEGTAAHYDFYSNGFKNKYAGGSLNSNGRTYIYMAFGQSLVGSNNVPCTAR
jgi:hypothetical protein